MNNKCPTFAKLIDVIGNYKTFMLQRPITSLEKDLIQHLIKLIPGNPKRYEIPSFVLPIKDGGMGSLQLKEDNVGQDLIQYNTKTVMVNWF